MELVRFCCIGILTDGDSSCVVLMYIHVCSILLLKDVFTAKAHGDDVNCVSPNAQTTLVWLMRIYGLTPVWIVLGDRTHIYIAS